MECLLFSTLRQPTGVSSKKIQRIVEEVLRAERRAGDVSIHLIADTKMIRLQKLYRGKKGTTDVLSFAAQEGKKMEGSLLGDIFICIPQIRRQAKTWSVSFQEEFNRMLIHGLLHILGYDHLKKSEAKIMFGKQEKYLERLM